VSAYSQHLHFVIIHLTFCDATLKAVAIFPKARAEGVLGSILEVSDFDGVVGHSIITFNLRVIVRLIAKLDGRIFVGEYEWLVVAVWRIVEDWERVAYGSVIHVPATGVILTAKEAVHFQVSP